MLEEEKTSIDKLQDALYSRDNEPIINERRRQLSKKDISKPGADWVDDDDKFRDVVDKSFAAETKVHPFFKKLLFVSLAFFVIAGGAAAFIFLVGSNVISSKNVDISVVGPLSITAGETLPLNIVVTNRNNTNLESATLLVEYPQGTRSPSDVNKELLRDNISLGTITSGGNITKEFSAVLFGEKESIKTIKITVEYKIKGSNALFSKEKLYNVSITSSPVIMTVDYPKEVTSEDNMVIIVSVTSNSTSLIPHLLIAAGYPFGFIFASGTPLPDSALSSQNVWTLDNLKPSETRKIKIEGQLQGDQNQERTFTFKVGIPGDQNKEILGAVFVSSLNTILLKEPFLGLSLQANGTKNNPYVSTMGDGVTIRINLKNNLTATLLNNNIKVVISGSAINRSAIFTDNLGFYRSIDNLAFWNPNTDPKLQQLGPGESTSVSMTLRSLSPSVAEALRNPEMDLDVTVSGDRLSPGENPETVSSNAHQQIKIASNLLLTPQIIRSGGPFENSGPIPPKAEAVTTYTVVWSLSNSYNTAKSVSVKAKLPEYITWQNLKSPTQEKINYNPTTREITWEAGDLLAYVGINSPAKQVFFQVSFLPSLGQVGGSPVVVGSQTVTATDFFTNTSLGSTKSPLTISFRDDPTFKQGDDRVTQ